MNIEMFTEKKIEKESMNYDEKKATRDWTAHSLHAISNSHTK